MLILVVLHKTCTIQVTTEYKISSSKVRFFQKSFKECAERWKSKYNNQVFGFAVEINEKLGAPVSNMNFKISTCTQAHNKNNTENDNFH